jgi:hypothetical protein
LKNIIRDLSSGRYKNKTQKSILKGVRDLSHEQGVFL